MRTIVLALALAVSPGCTRSMALANVTIVADGLSTWRASDHGRWDSNQHESNVILGPSPSGFDLLVYNTNAVFANCLANVFLPKWARAPLNLIVSSYEIYLVVHNESLGGAHW